MEPFPDHCVMLTGRVQSKTPETGKDLDGSPGYQQMRMGIWLFPKVTENFCQAGEGEAPQF